LITRTFTGATSRPLCVTVTLLPATVIVALRGVLDVFAVRVNVTVPGPEPPPLIVSHDGAPDADHGHPDCVVTPTVGVEAEARAVTLAGDTE